jgi:cytoskeleton protein RodZ
LNEEKNMEEDSRFSRGEETIGEIIIEARENVNLSLDDQTRITRKNLEYLETDNFDALPAKVYVRGFLKTYAQFLGLDVEHMLNKYEVQSGQTHRSKGDTWEIQTDEIAREKYRFTRLASKYLIPAVIVVFLVLLIIKFAGKQQLEVEPPSSVPEAENFIVQKDINEYAPSEVRGAEDKKSKNEMEDEEVDLEGGEKIIGEETGGMVTLIITAYNNDTTWFDLITLSGTEGKVDTTFYDFLLFPGQSESFEASRKIVLRKVGNAGGFMVELNGEVLPPLGDKGEVKTNIEFVSSKAESNQ